jgi:hypothetical protein
MIIYTMKENGRTKKEIFDPVSGQWIPTDMTEDDVMRLMQQTDALKAEAEIFTKTLYKKMGATEGWTQEEN